MIAAMLLVAIFGLLTWNQFDTIQAARQWVRHTYEVIGTADKLGIALRRPSPRGTIGTVRSRSC
jgi:hypothetical protein